MKTPVGNPIKGKMKTPVGNPVKGKFGVPVGESVGSKKAYAKGGLTSMDKTERKHDKMEGAKKPMVAAYKKGGMMKKSGCK